MKILLIDLDSKIPNLALMKLSTYFKQQGNIPDFIQLGISYYPTRKKHKIVDGAGYDKIYVSVVFQDTLKYVKIINNSNIEIGGSGYSLKKKLSPEIEKLDCDYSLYPDNDKSYGFITRGCIRKCKFCIVPEKEGMIHQVNTIDKIVKHNKVIFMDNNILAWKNHLSILEELRNKKIRCTFNQGLDIRLINHHNAKLLSELNYLNEYIFAFDNLQDESIIKQKLLIIKKYISNPWKLKFYIYCHPNMSIINDVWYRIQFCLNNKILPYFMRDITCFSDTNKNLYTDLAAWCNQIGLIKNMAFKEFMHKRHTKNIDRINTTLSYLK